jgi:4-hydroxyacetophenone monooxygenase
MFHTTQWDHGFQFEGKRVALIGTGSTGVQLMPALARGASHLTVYQRSANWIANAPGYRDKVPPETRLLFDQVPFYWNWYCYSSFDTSVQLQNAQTYDHEWRKTNPGISEINEKVRANLIEYMRDKLQGREDLIEKCMPDHPPLARRLVVDNGFYESLLRPNVELVTDGIERITPKGILGRDGVEREYDLIVLGAGFHVTRYLFPVNYVGRGGMTLEKAWEKDGARAYLGMVMPDFPNLFMMYGPNGQPRSGGFYSWAEIWARYIAGVIVKLVEDGKHSAAIRPEVFDNYNERLDAADAEILWREESKDSYYNNEFGRQAVNISFRTEDLHAMLVEPDMSEYDVR